jgi:hypothetical protein
MKKLLLILLILAIWSSSTLAETHHCPFGFSINIPSHWLIMSAEEVKNNPDLFDFKNEIFKNTNKSMLEQLKNMVVSGKVEIYYNQKTADNYFADNMNVFKRLGRLPQSTSEAKALCESLPDQFSSMYGKPTKVYSCGSRKVSGFDAFYVDFDGVADGTRSMTYEIQKSQNVIISLTATCKNRTLPIIKKESEEILASIQMK